ncbi:DUF3954 domain-containing protein [Alkalibacillus silvisoli]|uniref:DUF3954 domain-containing protein n=1 Tax=Alkalibacillus silvisoli TaxID=392823 RepID=A0ABN1AC33_9BACI
MNQTVKVVDQSVYVARNGELERLEIPKTGHGEVEIKWHQGKISNIKETQTRK